MYAYGQRPSDIPTKRLALDWIRGVRHLKSLSATGSYWHVHEEVQFLYCFKGEFAYEFRDRPSVVLTAGHAIVIPAGLEHRHLRAVDPAGHRIEFLLSAPKPGAKAGGSFSRALTCSLLATLMEKNCKALPFSRDLQPLFAELDELAVRGQSLSETELALARTLLNLMLLRVTSQPVAPARQVLEVRLMDETLAWLEKHFREPLSIDRLVAYTGYSRSRLFEIFRENTGLTPADWIARRRIREACLLLETTEESTSSIARTCGFSSSQYFNSVFKQRTGKTPSEWRKRPTA